MSSWSVAHDQLAIRASVRLHVAAGCCWPLWRAAFRSESGPVVKHGVVRVRAPATRQWRTCSLWRCSRSCRDVVAGRSPVRGCPCAPVISDGAGWRACRGWRRRQRRAGGRDRCCRRRCHRRRPAHRETALRRWPEKPRHHLLRCRWLAGDVAVDMPMWSGWKRWEPGVDEVPDPRAISSVSRLPPTAAVEQAARIRAAGSRAPDSGLVP